MDAILFWNRFEGRGLRGTSLSRATGQFAVVETALAEVLTSTTSLPETAQAAARAKAGERYDEFLNALGRRLAKGPKLRQEISEELEESSSDPSL